jgi:hypothetical protein
MCRADSGLTKGRHFSLLRALGQVCIAQIGHLNANILLKQEQDLFHVALARVASGLVRHWLASSNHLRQNVQAHQSLANLVHSTQSLVALATSKTVPGKNFAIDGISMPGGPFLPLPKSSDLSKVSHPGGVSANPDSPL